MEQKEMVKEMEQELNKLSKKELIAFFIRERWIRYSDSIDLLKLNIKQILQTKKDKELLKINEECNNAYKEMLEAQKMCTTQEYLDLEAKLKKLQTEPYTKNCYKDITDHNKKINKVLDAMIAIKKPLTTAKRKYLDLCKRARELYKC